MKKPIAKPVNPFKPLFLSAILVLGGCASKPANITLDKGSSGHYWKWIADKKAWVYFDKTGKEAGSVTERDGLWDTAQSCVTPSDVVIGNEWSFYSSNRNISFSGEHYDTAQHAEKMVEDMCNLPLRPPAPVKEEPKASDASKGVIHLSAKEARDLADFLLAHADSLEGGKK